MVDAADLKSVSPSECGFKSHLGHSLALSGKRVFWVVLKRALGFLARKSAFLSNFIAMRYFESNCKKTDNELTTKRGGGGLFFPTR